MSQQKQDIKLPKQCITYMDLKFDKKATENEIQKVEKIPYDFNNPYAYQFSNKFSEYPYGADYKDEFSDNGNRYLPVFPSYNPNDFNFDVKYFEPVKFDYLPGYLTENDY